MLLQNRQVRIYSYQPSVPPIIIKHSSRKVTPQRQSTPNRQQLRESSLKSSTEQSTDRIKLLFERINEMSSRIDSLSDNTKKLQQVLRSQQSVKNTDAERTTKKLTQRERSFTTMMDDFIKLRAGSQPRSQQTYEGSRDDAGQPHGEGTLFTADGKVLYNGNWNHGMIDARGKLFFETANRVPEITIGQFRHQAQLKGNRVSYTGQFVRGKMTGLGQMLFKGPDLKRFIYYGRFNDGWFDGNGVVVEMFGCEQKLEGIWHMGVYQS